MYFRGFEFANGFYYHIYNRAIDKKDIFSTRALKLVFIETCQYYLSIERILRFSVYKKLVHKNFLPGKDVYGKVAAFCIMPNHFHILMRQIVKNGISNYMSLVLNSFTRYFNSKTNRVGDIFPTPFRAVEIKTKQQLLHVSRYIHLNPYTSRLVNNKIELFNYPYSSVTYYSNRKQTLFPFIYSDDILEHQNKKKYLNFIWNNADYQRRLKIRK